MGEIYSALDLPHEAEKAFEKAIQLSPKWPELRFHLATIKIKLNKFDEAIKIKNREINITDIILNFEKYNTLL